jgi:hypothetical protein
VTVTVPGTSSERRSPGPCDSVSARNEAANSAPPINTLTNSTQRQLMASVSRPPATAPKAPPDAAVIPHHVSARVRARGST